jgi:hypothetical protein
LNNIVARAGTVQFHGVWTYSQHYAARNIFFGPYIYGTCCFANGANIPAVIKTNVRQFDSNVVYNAGNPPTITAWGGTATLYTWAQWQAAGLDVHSSIADPLFTDTTKVFRADYQPRGDFSVRTGSPALALGFRNFPMDSFGVMGIAGPPPVAVQNPFIDKINGMSSGSINVHYSAGRLIVSHDGDYRVTITTALGRTLKVFKGKGCSSVTINARISGTGIYFAVVHAKNGAMTRRFIVD